MNSCGAADRYLYATCWSNWLRLEEEKFSKLQDIHTFVITKIPEKPGHFSIFNKAYNRHKFETDKDNNGNWLWLKKADKGGEL